MCPLSMLPIYSYPAITGSVDHVLVTIPHFPKKGGNPMAKFIPYEKLSKKTQRELNLQKRETWNGFNPVTRRPEDSKVYNRRKAQRWKKNFGDVLLFCA